MARAMRNSKSGDFGSPTCIMRAFEVFTDIPPGCQIQYVEDPRHEPHLREGEWCIVDPGEREPELFELFAVLQSNGVNIWQIGPDDRKDHDKECFWLHPLDRMRGGTEAERMADFNQRAAHGRVNVSDGPIYGWALRERIIGRVIGVYQGSADSRNLAHEPVGGLELEAVEVWRAEQC